MIFGLQTVARRGFSPRTIVDVGAYEGAWTMLAHSVWPTSIVIMIEANRAKISRLREIGETHCELLGAAAGQSVAFNVMETGSSVLSEHSSVPREIEIRTLSTLDSLSLNLEGPGLLKIDAQGYELEILKGAVNSLRIFEAILLEVAVIEINEGAPLLADVVSFMDKLDFVASEVLEVHRRPLDRALSQMDILFIRRGSPLLSDRRYC
jgi:FkbM family methyltransferase